MNYLVETEWGVGEPGNGDRATWQCPPTCRQNGVDYSGQDPRVQFPRGLLTHVKAGRPDETTFHQGAIFEPERVAVVSRETHAGITKNVLRLAGGDLHAKSQAMVVKKFIAPVAWKQGQRIFLKTWFMPTSENFPNVDIAREHLFANIELRGERSVQAKFGANQAFGVYFRGDNIFIMYWSETTEPATTRTMIRTDFGKGVTLNKWHKLSMQLIGTEIPDEWSAQFTVRLDGQDIVRWVSEWNIKKMSQITIVALGDERPNNFDGGTFYWEPLRIWTNDIDEQ
jgi:hypothetical protein